MSPAATSVPGSAARETFRAPSDSISSEGLPFAATVSPAGEGAPRPLFAPGRVVAQRYRVERFLARGGMGDVYEAHDLELGTRVALKVVRQDTTADPVALQRLRREVALARRVTHVNVARLFDVGYEASGLEAPVAFLTMELLPGRSLAEHLRERAPLPLDEALAIAEQLAAALDAAHEAGVVHRDFKSSNVLLVPSAPPLPSVRAVVTDFGLAQAVEPSDARITTEGTFIGTPAYVAPEQVEGAHVTSAADLYAFGVVLYEMVTGRMPFEASSAVLAAVMRLHRDPTPPRAHAPALPQGWSDAILGCLARAPKDRFATASAVIHAIRTGEVARRARRSPRWGARAAAVATIAAAATIGSVVAVSRPRAPALATPVSAPPSVAAVDAAAAVAARPGLAVLDIQPIGAAAGDAWMAGAVEEILRTSLASSRSLRVFSGGATRDAMRDAMRDLGGRQGDAGEATTSDVQRLGKRLDARYLVEGALVSLPGRDAKRLRLDVHVRDTQSGEILASVGELGDATGLPELVERAASGLRSALGVAAATGAEQETARASVPASPALAKAYVDGVAQLRAHEVASARALLEKVVAEDPGYVLGHSALAEALAEQGLMTRAADEARRALSLGGPLAREDRLMLEARAYEASYEGAKAIDTLRILAGFFPDVLDYTLSLARAQARFGQAQEALATLDAVRARGGAGADDPRLLLVRAQALGQLGNVREQRKVAQEAAARARDVGARLIAAEAGLEAAQADLWVEGPSHSADELLAIEQQFRAAGHRIGALRTAAQRAYALYRAGEPKRAIELAEATLRDARAIGHRGLEASLLQTIGLSAQKDDLRRARPFHEQALAIAREIGDRRVEFHAGHSLATLEEKASHLAVALRGFEHGVELARSTGSPQSIARSLASVADVTIRLGELDKSWAAGVEAIPLFQRAGDRRGEAYAIGGLASVAEERGDLATADERIRASTAIFRELADEGEVANCDLTSATIARDRGDAAAARTILDEALRGYRDVQDSTGIASVELAIARNDVEDGEAATERVRRANATNEREEVRDLLAEGTAVLALSLQIEGRGPDAIAAAERALAMIERFEDAETRIEVTTHAAKVLANGGQAARARAMLTAIVDEAHRRGMIVRELEARLALVDARRAAGEGVDDERRAIAEIAAAKGLGGIAARAGAPKR